MITAEGRWEHDIFGQSCWNINTSSILTQLIQDAGKYCEDFASDLFIQWKVDVDDHLIDRDWKGGEFGYGFREYGVDHNEWIKNHKNNPYYYRKIRTLKIIIDDDIIKMELN